MNKNFFDFLSSTDRFTLEARAIQREFSDGEVILQQGESNASLYIIKNGDVSIVTRMLEHTFEIDQLHKNDLFGDMSFVDADATSTDIIAIGSVSIDVITKADVQEIIRADAMFYGRFYHALARLLSWRLRKMNAQLEHSSFEE